jgi:hypothetical protein
MNHDVYFRLSFRLDQLLDKHWRDELGGNNDDGDVESSNEMCVPVDGDPEQPTSLGTGRRGGFALVSPPVGAAFVDAETRRLFSLDNGMFFLTSLLMIVFCFFL